MEHQKPSVSSLAVSSFEQCEMPQALQPKFPPLAGTMSTNDESSVTWLKRLPGIIGETKKWIDEHLDVPRYWIPKFNEKNWAWFYHPPEASTTCCESWKIHHWRSISFWCSSQLFWGTGTYPISVYKLLGNRVSIIGDLGIPIEEGTISSPILLVQINQLCRGSNFLRLLRNLFNRSLCNDSL